MSSVNDVTLVGYIGKAPEYRELGSGVSLLQASLATSDRYKRKDGTWDERTDWHQLVFWGKLAENAERLIDKGTHLYIRGSIKYESYENKKGDTVWTTKITVHSFTLLSPRESSSERTASPESASKHRTKGNTRSGSPSVSESTVEDDGSSLPF